MYTTPEGFELHRPLLLPNARSFTDVLEYLGEWDQFKTGESRFAGSPPEPRYIEAGGAGANVIEKLIGHDPTARNEIGPFCTIDLGQLGGPPHRSIAVRATDAVMNAISNQIVTDDDHLSFELVGHVGTERVLVILKHGHIIGSHYLAYIDPATIPAYPYEARDAKFKGVCEAIKENGEEPFVKRVVGGDIEVQIITGKGPAPDFRRIIDPVRRATIHADGRVTRVWADGTENTEPAP